MRKLATIYAQLDGNVTTIARQRIQAGQATTRKARAEPPQKAVKKAQKAKRRTGRRP